MKIAIVAATQFELNGLPDFLSAFDPTITYQVHGPGLLQAVYHLTNLLADSYELVIQCGVAGSYSPELQPGATVVVQTEELGDLGAEDHDAFLDLFQLGLSEKNKHPFRDGKLLNNQALEVYGLPVVSGLTVSSVSGNASTIQKRQQRFHAAIETMEGAALHYCCLMKGVPFLQVRGISNMVEPRNKENWQLEVAMHNYQQHLKSILEQIINPRL